MPVFFFHDVRKPTVLSPTRRRWVFTSKVHFKLFLCPRCRVAKKRVERFRETNSTVLLLDQFSHFFGHIEVVVKGHRHRLVLRVKHASKFHAHPCQIAATVKDIAEPSCRVAADPHLWREIAWVCDAIQGLDVRALGPPKVARKVKRRSAQEVHADHVKVSQALPRRSRVAQEVHHHPSPCLNPRSQRVATTDALRMKVKQSCVLRVGERKLSKMLQHPPFVATRIFGPVHDFERRRKFVPVALFANDAYADLDVSEMRRFLDRVHLFLDDALPAWTKGANVVKTKHFFC